MAMRRAQSVLCIALGGALALTCSTAVAAPSRERVSTSVEYLQLGRARLTVTSNHPPELHWGGRTVSWYVGRGADGRLRRVTFGKTRDIAPGVTRMTAAVALPQAGPFRYAACFSAPRQDSLGLGSSHGPCGTHRFRGPASSPYVGAGVAPSGFPEPAAVAAATRYLNRRTGYTAFATVDSEGRIGGEHLHRTFVSASVVKAMLLVAYLRKLAAEHRGLDSTSRSLLDPMIHVSDNNAATAVWERVGDPRLRTLARRAGMTDFSIVGIWANAQISPADQARYFFEMESLIPHQFRHLARHLLSHIAAFESWGIPAVARPRGWTVFFKGGWRGTGRGQLVHQIARLQKPGERVAIAVMTDGDPSMGYGIETIQGVTARLLNR
ncbi:MAG TPA: serine hydrolase [Solirubrobacterales bacterium]|nr:serine hydrolase [Solirubrobacterales bacterium]